ncbi:MAG: PhzF family phenazine biosynthesis protein [Pseudomonadota bacterium]|nr:PhzF family phenazine biosynthesis protein [Pseudomonadota bacterium]MEE3098944.1 PhzF family phenazine biosynthesis protein [Pseudomonadota bacterium]
MARAFPFDWVEAFASVPFGGNPCAVFHGADGIDVATRLKLVRETSLVECAFVVPSAVADFGARYYLPTREIPMAGHPTVATVVSLVSRGLVDLSAGPARFTLEVGAGVMPIEASRDADGTVHVAMEQAAPVFGAEQDPAEIAGIYGLSAADILGTPRIVSTGTPFCVTLLRDRAALDRARLDVARLEAWRAGQGAETGAAAIMEPFLAVLSGATAGGDTCARLLLAPPAPPEDPFTGSATGCLGAYLWHGGWIERPDFVAEQGHGLGRPGRAEVEALGPREAPTGVRVAGPGVVLMRGELLL